MWPFKKKIPLYVEFPVIRIEHNAEAVLCKGREFRSGIILIQKIYGWVEANKDGTVNGSYVTKWYRA